MALDKFEYVLAIAEDRNITRAAKKLFLSQPALTVYINKLEDELGAKLFDRTVNPIEITKAGELYVTEMRKIKDAQDSLYQKLYNMTREKRQQLVVGIGKSRGACWLPYLVPLYETAHPDIVLKIVEETEANIEHGITRGLIDVGIGALPVISSDIMYEVVATEKFVIAIPKSNPIISNFDFTKNSYDTPLLIDASLLNNQKFICAAPGYGMYRTAKRLFDTYNISPKEILTINNSETAFRMAASGVGIVFTVSTLSKNYPDVASNLFYCTLSEVPFARSIVAIYSKNRPLSTHAKLFVEHLNKIDMDELGLV